MTGALLYFFNYLQTSSQKNATDALGNRASILQENFRAVLPKAARSLSSTSAAKSSSPPSFFVDGAPVTVSSGCEVGIEPNQACEFVIFADAGDHELLIVGAFKNEKVTITIPSTAGITDIDMTTTSVPVLELKYFPLQGGKHYNTEPGTWVCGNMHFAPNANADYI